MSDFEVQVGFGAFLALLLLVLLLFDSRKRRGKPSDSVRYPKPRRVSVDGSKAMGLPRVVVDGSNVLHWSGAPSELVLNRVIKDLRRQGFNPVVVFDASVGYKLGDQYMGSAAMAQVVNLDEDSVYVVNKGVVADEVILDLAQDHGWKVVSNDRYREWSERFSIVKDHRNFRRGEWKQGSVVWHD